MQAKEPVKSEYLTVRLPAHIKFQILNIAIKQDRTVSYIAAQLIKKALLGGRPRGKKP